jgi:hypothetical protein
MAAASSPEIQALTELYESLVRDPPGPMTDAGWFTHGFMIGAALGAAHPDAAQRYANAVAGDAQRRTGTSTTSIETEYRRGADELARRLPGA